MNEPSVVARHNRDNAIVAVGAEARSMQGRTPGSISVIRPMRDGVIADYLTTEAMLRYFIGLVTGRFNLIRPEVMVTVPRRDIGRAAGRAGRRGAGGGAQAGHLVPGRRRGNWGAAPIGQARGNMVLNIGGGRTEAAVIALYGIVVSESVRMAGDRIDEAIVAYVRRRHNLIIGERTAEEIKLAIGSALPIDRA
jgi:rod shape-determining protein MreB